MSMLLTLGIAGALALVVGGVWMSRRGTGGGAEPALPHDDGDDGAAPLGGPAAAPTPAPSPAPTVPPPAATAAPTGRIEHVMLETGGSVYGAVPPYGNLTLEGDVLRYEATTSIVSASGSVLFSGEGSSTLQSMGSMEMGNFVFTVPTRGSSASEADGGVDVVADGETYRFVGLGPGSVEVPKLLRAAGIAL